MRHLAAVGHFAGLNHWRWEDSLRGLAAVATATSTAICAVTTAAGAVGPALHSSAIRWKKRPGVDDSARAC